MPVATPRPVLPLDAALAVAVGGLAWLSTRWDAWWEAGRSDMPMRHGPPFREPTLDLASTSWSLPWLVALGGAVLASALIVRRLVPRTAFVAVLVGTAAFLAGGGPYGPVLLAPVLGVLAMATTLPLRRWAPWLAGLPVMLSAGFWRQPYGGLLDRALWPAAIFGSAAIILPALVVVLRRSRRDAEARERELERDRYVYAERMRIAREVHDVVGHSLSVIHLQAGVAQHVLDKRPDQVAASLEAIRVSSKDALAELRHTLGVFRDDDGPSPRSPQAGLARLGDLAGALNAAGRSVEVRADGGLTDTVPPAVDHAAYRIVQEALTNVVRHAANASAVVELSLDEGSLHIVITDDGPALTAADLQPGNGIRGMTERAAAVHGRLEVRPGAQGGAVVEAWLPTATHGVAP